MQQNLHENPMVSQRVKNFQEFMKPEYLLPCSQQLVTLLCHQLIPEHQPRNMKIYEVKSEMKFLYIVVCTLNHQILYEFCVIPAHETHNMAAAAINLLLIP